MLRSTPRAVRLALALTAALALMLAGSPAAASPSTGTTTWKLQDWEQRICIHANESYWTYFLVVLDGEWSTPVQLGVRDLPAGTVMDAPPQIPPGTGNGSNVNGWLMMTLPPLAHGVYRATLTASDGVSTQTAPITIQAQDRWGCWGSA